MKSIIKIFQIRSNDEYIDLSNIDRNNIIDFGNGFFISKDGHIASVAHVITNEGVNSYAMWNGKLQKIEIIERELTERNQNHIDIAIGKININQRIDFIEKYEIEEVKNGMSITLIGYSRTINKRVGNSELHNELKSELIKQNSFCFDTKYYFSNKRIPMHNFFSFVLDSYNLGGLSGSPIINENNKVVGIFKGGGEIGNRTFGQALHIKKISKYF